MSANSLPRLKKKFPKLDLQVITSELPDELRKQRIEEMGKSPLRVLVATDCLSEGINLQEHFTAVLHYDLPWNPNRLEQREGRVDRFGQMAPEVKACLLYGADNPIDGIVLDVLLRKVREIKRATGINVPFPEDSQSIIDTITQALLLNPDRQIDARSANAEQQLAFDFERLRRGGTQPRPTSPARSTRPPSGKRRPAASLPRTPSRPRRSKPTCARWTRPSATRRPWRSSSRPRSQSLRCAGHPGCQGLSASSPATCRLSCATSCLPGDPVKVSFIRPRPRAITIWAATTALSSSSASSSWPTPWPGWTSALPARPSSAPGRSPTKTTLLLFRCRNVIEQSKGGHQIVAEEMLLWGWRGTPQQKEFLDHTQAKALLAGPGLVRPFAPGPSRLPGERTEAAQYP